MPRTRSVQDDRNLALQMYGYLWSVTTWARRRRVDYGPSSLLPTKPNECLVLLQGITEPSAPMWGHMAVPPRATLYRSFGGLDLPTQSSVNQIRAAMSQLAEVARSIPTPPALTYFLEEYTVYQGHPVHAWTRNWRKGWVEREEANQALATRYANIRQAEAAAKAAETQAEKEARWAKEDAEKAARIKAAREEGERRAASRDPYAAARARFLLCEPPEWMQPKAAPDDLPESRDWFRQHHDQFRQKL